MKRLSSIKIINKIGLISILVSLAIFYSFCSIGENKSIILNSNNFFKQEQRNVMIPFAKDSFNLSEEAVLNLKKYVNYVNSIIKENCYILIYPWCAINETKKNSNIGILRSKTIIDFYEKNYSTPRKFFLIMDVTHFDDEDWALNPGRNDSFVTFGARFCNPPKEN